MCCVLCATVYTGTVLLLCCVLYSIIASKLVLVSTNKVVTQNSNHLTSKTDRKEKHERKYAALEFQLKRLGRVLQANQVRIKHLASSNSGNLLMQKVTIRIGWKTERLAEILLVTLHANQTFYYVSDNEKTGSVI